MAGKNQPKVIIIKKKAKGHGAHGAAWKVAYADFVTAMMALFMVLWLVSQTDHATQVALAHYFRTGILPGSAQGVLAGNRGSPISANVADPSRQEDELLKSRAKQLREMIKRAAGEDPAIRQLQEHVQVQVTSEGLLIQIMDGGDGLFFARSSSDLKPPLAEFLKRIAPVLGQLPNKLRIHGHTDSTQFSAKSGRSNWQLSFERADNARRFLEQAGVREGQIVSVIGHGDTALLVPTDPNADANRRLSILALRHGAEHEAELLKSGEHDDAAAAKPTEDVAPTQGAEAAPGPIDVPDAVEAKPEAPAEHHDSQH